jgi:MarR family transcriptional regulator, organic hydroperoxide resistance regulator
MSLAALHACLARERARAAASFRLDDELGTHHGISWIDFVLLHSLHDSAGAMADAELAARLGMLRSHLRMRVRPLEKLGLVACQTDARERRVVALTAAGNRLAQEARETAAHVCSRL